MLLSPVAAAQSASRTDHEAVAPVYDEREERFRRKTLPAIACILGLVGAVVLTFLTPPLQVPDENRHFFRAYQLSEGHVFSKVVNGRAGDNLPISLHAMELALLNEEGSMPQRPPAVRPRWTTLKAELQRPLDPGNVKFVDFTGAAFYSPLPYVPQIVAIAAGRVFHLSPVALLYLARLANAIAAVILIAWAIRIAPFGQEALLFLGLLPMALFQYASVSADALVIATCIAFFAVALRAQARGEWTNADFVAAVPLAIVFCSLKPVYAPFLLVGLIPMRWDRREILRSLRSHAILCAVVLGISLTWLVASSPAMVVNNYPSNQGVNPSGQMHFIASHPFRTLQVVAESFFAWGGYYRVGVVGMFGWLTVLLPDWAYYLPWVWVGALALARPAPQVDRQAIWKFVLATASAVLVMIALYIIWAPLAYKWVSGVQGRYFIPCAVLAGVAICPKPGSSRWRARYAILTVLVAVNIAVTFWTVATQFLVR